MIVERKEKEIAALIGDGASFLISGHVRPDADCIGSQLGLYLALTKLGRKAEIWMADEVPYTCRFLPSSGVIRAPRGPATNFDTALILDTPKPDRLGTVADAVAGIRVRVNIDHHPSNVRWGTHNWVDAGASATAEFVYLLLDEMAVAIDKDIATCLYAGIMTDTGKFCYSNTTAFTHRVVSELLSRGVSPSEVSDNLYCRNRPERIKLLGMVLGSLRIDEGGELAWVWIRRDMYRKSGARTQDTEGFINYARDINGVRVAVLFEEQPAGGRVRVSLRSRDRRLDVNRIAARFGGGGHAAAAGALIEGDPEGVEERLLGVIRDEISRNRDEERLSPGEKAGGPDIL